MEIRLENGRADAHFKEFVLPTGGGDAPSPYELFLASLGTCAGLTAVGYCKAHELPSEGMKVLMDVERDPETRLASSIKMQLVLPDGFPEERRVALIKAAESCFVKRHLYAPPHFETTVAE
jgi:ribosomal protein S12 methylthiotransferase accessory factor